MPRKSTINHLGDIFVASTTNRSKRAYRTIYGHIHTTPIFNQNHADTTVYTYGNIAGKSYEAESSAVHNLVQDLTSPKYAAAVTAVGLMPWVIKLRADNDAVGALIGNRDNEAAAKTQVNAREARGALDAIYKKIIARVNSHAGEDATPAISTFVTKMNIIVKRFDTLLKHHRHHKGAAGAETEAGEESETGE